MRPHGYFTENHRRKKLTSTAGLFPGYRPGCQVAQEKTERRAGNSAQFRGTVIVDLFTCFQVGQVREANANVMLASTSAKNTQ